GLAPWRDGQGHLLGWRRPVSDASRPRVLLVHGNAGEAMDRAAYLEVFESAGFEGVLLEYPGYGPRPGNRQESVMVADAQAALHVLATERPGPVFLLGESLGTGVAVQVAVREPGRVAGLLLVAPFARMTEVASRHYPWLPMGLLLRDRWDNLSAMPRYSGPVALLVAGQDEVVGADQGHRLARAVPGPMRLWEVPGASHNGLPLVPGRPPWSDMLAFLREPSRMGE
ncbi:MAG TPA: alpha/beta fold hydrolase, partial [Holophagaceae bacterium]